MKINRTQFLLRAWRHRMGWTQTQAASSLGKSVSAYRCAEYRNEDHPGHPCEATLALLAQALERERTRSAA